MNSNFSAESVARTLIEARRSGTPAPACAVPGPTEAYAVQQAVAQALHGFEGGMARHWKSGGPSLQAALTHAPLPSAGVLHSPADLRAQHFNVRGIEAEIALRLRAPVDAARAAALDHAGALELVDAMCVSIEIVDTRWIDGLQAPAWTKLADLQSHGALVLGEWQPFSPRDWSAQTVEVRIGAQAPRRFCGTHLLGDPAAVLLPWLRHATRQGGVLPAGAVVTTGTWCGLPMAEAGDEVWVGFDGIGSAGVRL